MEPIYDAIILGGGPAGSAAAITLAKAGRKVLVLERDRFPRFHIGESLLPFSMESFDRLGVREKLDRRFLIKHGAEFLTCCGGHHIQFFFKDGFLLPQGTSYQVTRAEFDKLLLDHARETGAEVREETGVKDVAFDGEGATVLLDCGEKVRGKYAIDATGRNTLLGAKFGLKQSYPNLQKFAVYAHFDHVDRAPGPEGSFTRMVRTANRWFWMIPLGETKMSIGVVMDTAEFKRLKLPPEAFLEAAIQEQPVITRRMGRATRVSPVYATGDYSYRNSRFAGDRWLLTGDAAGFIDPVFSTGVFLAITSGEEAAQAVNIALAAPKRGPARFRGYERNLHRVMDIYLKFVSAWYTPEFIEIFVHPERRFKIPQAVNSVLGGNVGLPWPVRWRMEIFYLLLKIQKCVPICPRLDLTPGPAEPVPLPVAIPTAQPVS